MIQHRYEKWSSKSSVIALICAPAGRRRDSYGTADESRKCGLWNVLIVGSTASEAYWYAGITSRQITSQAYSLLVHTTIFRKSWFLYDRLLVTVNEETPVTRFDSYKRSPSKLIADEIFSSNILRDYCVNAAIPKLISLARRYLTCIRSRSTSYSEQPSDHATRHERSHKRTGTDRFINSIDRNLRHVLTCRTPA
jgi:hypothetical protein